MRLHIVGTPNTIVPPAAQRVGDAPRGSNRADVVRRAAAPERPERAQQQPVDVVQRQGVHDPVGGRPLPRVVHRRQVRAQRRARQHDALRRAGRARRVDDQRAARLGRAPVPAIGRARSARGQDQLGRARRRGCAPRSRGARTSGSAARPRSPAARPRQDQHDAARSDARRPRRSGRPRSRPRASGADEPVQVGARDARRRRSGAPRRSQQRAEVEVVQPAVAVAHGQVEVQRRDGDQPVRDGLEVAARLLVVVWSAP